MSGGLLPPLDGCPWQPRQLVRFMVGPRPSSLTVSTFANSSAPAQNSFVSFSVNPGIGFVTSVQLRSLIRLKSVDGRNPGSCGVCAWPIGIKAFSAAQTNAEYTTHLRTPKHIAQ